MERNALQATASGGCTADEIAMRRSERKAWFVRAAAVTFLAAGGIISYLVFSAV